MNAVRDAALKLVALYVPSDTGDARFSEIIGPDYGGVGSTCGFLVSWLFWRLGCKDGRIINRTDAASGLRYTVGANMTRLLEGAKALGAFRTIASGPPLPGDGIFYTNGPSNTEHVAIAVDCSTNAWKTADAGIQNQAGKQCARNCARTFDPKTGTASFTGGARKVAGIYSLEKIVPPPAEGVDFLALLGLAGLALRLGR